MMLTCTIYYVLIAVKYIKRNVVQRLIARLKNRRCLAWLRVETLARSRKQKAYERCGCYVGGREESNNA